MRARAKALFPSRRTILKWSLLAACGAVALTIDLMTKHLAQERLVLGETDKVLPFLYLQRTANDGIAFGLFDGKTGWIIVANVVAILVVLAYVFFERRPFLGGIAGGAVIGGSLGNMIERLAGDGTVTDFLKFPRWPNFNAADVFIDAGIAAIFLGLIVEAIKEWRAGRKRPASP
jgi:signal peptidase II